MKKIDRVTAYIIDKLEQAKLVSQSNLKFKNKILKCLMPGLEMIWDYEVPYEECLTSGIMVINNESENKLAIKLIYNKHKIGIVEVIKIVEEYRKKSARLALEVNGQIVWSRKERF